MSINKKKREELIKEKIIQNISEYVTQKGFSPSIRELALSCNMPTTTLHSYLKKLQDEGVLTMQQGVARSIVLKKAAK